MRRGVVWSIFLVSSFSAAFLLSQGGEISPSSEISLSQADALILYAADFVVAEDGVIFLTDAKEGNIKCYDPGGKLLNVIGRRGPGPEEFLGPSYCDYQAPFFSVLDSPKLKVHIYERRGRADLSKVAEIPCMMCTSDVILSGKAVLIDAVARNNERSFFLTLRNFRDESIKYLLPIERRYGYGSERSYKAAYNDLSMLTSQRGFLSVSDNRAYFVFDARPNLTGVDLDDLDIVTFRSPSPSYREPQINQTIRSAFSNKQSEPVKQERNKVSYITGILSDERMVGVLFSNYNPPSNSWRLYLQRYDKGGKFVSESLLREATNYDCLFSYYFDRGRGVLYVMAERYGDDSTDDYRILGYKLR